MVLPALVLLLQVVLGAATAAPTPEELGLPPQYDLDLPIVLDTYDPAFQAPAPTPRGDDPRDEPPPVFFGEEIETEGGALIYVVDCSGSMKHDNRIGQARAELRRSIAALSPSLRFNVVTYACTVRAWRSEAQQATPEAKAAACAWVDQQEVGGGTATGPAVVLALSDRSASAVVLLTDGAPNCGSDMEAHRALIRRGNLQQAAINVFGISATGDYRRFCQNVAADSGGSYYDVPITPPVPK